MTRTGTPKTRLDDPEQTIAIQPPHPEKGPTSWEGRVVGITKGNTTPGSNMGSERQNDVNQSRWGPGPMVKADTTPRRDGEIQRQALRANTTTLSARYP